MTALQTQQLDGKFNTAQLALTVQMKFGLKIIGLNLLKRVLQLEKKMEG